MTRTPAGHQALAWLGASYQPTTALVGSLGFGFADDHTLDVG